MFSKELLWIQPFCMFSEEFLKPRTLGPHNVPGEPADPPFNPPGTPTGEQRRGIGGRYGVKVPTQTGKEDRGVRYGVGSAVCAMGLSPLRNLSATLRMSCCAAHVGAAEL